MIKCFLMNKLSNYFYIFSKLTTSFILFLLIFFLGYALYNSYKDIDKKSENIDGKFLSLSENINLNSNKFKEIEESIKQNEILLSQIKKSLTKYNNEKIFSKLQKDNELLLGQIKILEGKIKELSNEQNKTTKKNIETDYPNNKLEELNSLKELIILKYKNGAKINNELILLSKLASNKSNHYLEKLTLLETKKFNGTESIYEEFTLSVETFAKEKFIETNNNTLINFLLRYVTIKPNDLDIYEDNNLNVILKAKQHLDLEEYDESLKQILILDPLGKHFKKWIDQITLFLEFELTLMKVE